MRFSKVLLVLATVLYLYFILWSPYSLVGVWSDLGVGLALSIFALYLIFRPKSKSRCKKMKKIRLLASIFLPILALISYVLGTNTLYQSLELFNVKSFTQVQIMGKSYNAYWVPVGSYSGGEGRLWITQSPKGFPWIEKEIVSKHTVLWDYDQNTFDGKKVNQLEILKGHLRQTFLSENKKTSD